VKFPSLTILVRTWGLGGAVARVPGEELRDRGRGLSVSASEAEAEEWDEGDEERGERSRSRAWNGL